MRILNFVALAGVIINLGLNFLLIPKFQSVGSAYAGMAAQIITAILQLVIAVRIFKFRINHSLIIRFILLILFMLTIIYTLNNFVIVDWKTGLLTLVLGGMLASFSLKLFNLKEFILIMKSRQ